MSKGLLLVISGFSGAGKGTVMKRLLELHDEYSLSISATTRKPREGEADGREYFFKTVEEFEKMIAEDALIEHAQYVGNYYGTPKAYVEEQLDKGNNVILEIEIQGAMNIKRMFPDAVLMFITPPSAAELEKRLRGRGTEDETTIKARLSRAAEEAERVLEEVSGLSFDDCIEEYCCEQDVMYDPDYVPVGEDQKQHVELCRDVAEKFNSRYSETFKLPEPLIAKVGGRIMDLQNPTKKMSKSDEAGKGTIYILDDINVSKKKIKSAVTDSDGYIHYDPENKPGISNLLEIYSIISERSIDDIEKQYDGKGYGEFKTDLAEIVGAELEKIQARYKEITTGSYLDDVLEAGANKARPIARKKLAKVERKIGITIKKK